VRAAEGLEEGPPVGPAAQAQDGHLEGGHPALRLRAQEGGLVVRVGVPEGAAEEVAGLGGGEAELGGAYLQELAPGPEPGQGEGRLAPSREDEGGVGRQRLREAEEEEAGPLVADEVAVVDDQAEGLVQGPTAAAIARTRPAPSPSSGRAFPASPRVLRREAATSARSSRPSSGPSSTPSQE